MSSTTSSTATTTTTPATTTCPSWCALPAGHPWGEGDMPGDSARTHSALKLSGPLVSGDPAWTAEVYAIEFRSVSGASLGEVGVGVQVFEELTPEQAAGLARAVTRAADIARSIAGCQA